MAACRKQFSYNLIWLINNLVTFGEMYWRSLNPVLSYQYDGASSFIVLVTMHIDDFVQTHLQGVIPVHTKKQSVKYNQNNL